MPDALTITIPGTALPSWNTVMRMHKHAQHEVHQTWIGLVLAAISPSHVPFTSPVDICITSIKTGRMIDADNLYVKGVIDGLKKRLFPDDSPRWVDSVKLCSRKGKANSVMIQLVPVEGK